VQVLRDSYVNPCPTIDPGGGSCVSHGGIVRVGWRDDETVVAYPFYGDAFYGPAYVVGLDGTPIVGARVTTPAPSSPTGGGASAAGTWQASVTASGGVGVVVGLMNDAGGEATHRISSATLPLWSPTNDSLLALLINVCIDLNTAGGFDLALFEPNSGEMVTVEEQPGRVIPHFAWRPDGRTIAADVVFTGESQTELRRDVALIGIADAPLAVGAEFPTRTLLSISRSGELIPVEWSPDGGKLIVSYSPGRGICEGTGTSAPGTKVEFLPR
jgi:hypothetical protein